MRIIRKPNPRMMQRKGIITKLDEKKNQENALKWLLLGLQLAQRVSNLLPLTEQNILHIPNLKNELVKCFVFTQKKSQDTKEIVLPIDEPIEELLKDGFLLETGPSIF